MGCARPRHAGARRKRPTATDLRQQRAALLPRAGWRASRPWTPSHRQSARGRVLPYALDSLSQMIAEDRSHGDLPIAIVGTAGTVGTGAIDPIQQLAKVARNENLWLHIDGAYGAFAVLAESCPPGLRALAEADSVACEPD